jgi:hypothetical protein
MPQLLSVGAVALVMRLHEFYWSRDKAWPYASAPGGHFCLASTSDHYLRRSEYRPFSEMESYM